MHDIFCLCLACTVGYPAKACPDFFGTSNRAMEEEVSKKVDMYIQMLLQTAERCENEGVRTRYAWCYSIAIVIKQK